MGVAIGEQIGKALHGGLVRRAAVECRQVHITGAQAADAIVDGLQLGQELAGFKRAQGVAALEGVQVQGHGGGVGQAALWSWVWAEFYRAGCGEAGVDNGGQWPTSGPASAPQWDNFNP